MNLSTEIAGNITIVSIEGDIDASNSNELTDYLLATHDDGWKTLIINFEAVPFMSSVGLRVLLDVYKKGETSGSTVSVATPGRGVMRVLNTSGFSTFLPCFATVDEAKAAAVARRPQ
jgi:anti-sigma B factor antagonist